MNIYLKKTCDFIYKKVSVTFIIFLIAGSVGCFIRLYPLRNYTSNEAWDKASLLVINNVMKEVRSQIRAQAGWIPLRKESRLATERINTLLSKDKKKVKKAILKLAKALDQKNPPSKNFPYLLASDSYYYYDLTETLRDTGHISPKIKGSKYFHPKMVAPDGYWEPLNLQPYVGLALYKIQALFQPDIPLMAAVSFTPLVLMLLAMIAFLIIARNLKASPWAALTAAIYFVCAQIFVKRSAFGWYDNDPYNVLFPMVLMMILSFALQARTRRAQVLSGVALAAGLTLYTLFWQGWVFIATILVTSGIAMFFFDLLTKTETDRAESPVIFGTLLLVTLLGISIIFGAGELMTLFREGWLALLEFFKTKLTVWPDTYIAVGELKTASFEKIVALSGGIFFFALAVIGAAFGSYRLWHSDRSSSHWKLMIPIMVFALAGLLVSLGAQRFALLCVTPLALLFLISIDEFLTLFKRLWKKYIPQKQQKWQPAALAAVLAILIIPRVVTAETMMPTLLDPLYNSTWEAALTAIKAETPPDAIISTWWPPGHFIKAIADRRVTFDGATINNRQSYWLANALMARSEWKALDYLRLMNNSGNRAVDLLLKNGMKDSVAVSFLKHLIHLPKAEALAKIQTVLGDPDQARQLLKLTHGQPPPTYLLIYNEMIKNLLLYPFVARWNFEKAEFLNDHPEVRKNIPSPRSQEYVDFLWNVAGGQPRISGILSPSGRKDGRIIFKDGLVIDLTDKTCRITSLTYGTGVPSFLFFEENGKVVKKPLAGANLPYSVAIGKRHGKYEAMLLETPLAESFLIRLYFWGDTGLKHVKQTGSYTNLTRQTQIDVFEVK